MGAASQLRAAISTVLLFVAATGGAECISAVRSVSEQNQFPNRVAGPVATNGTTVAVAKTDNSASTRAIYVSTYDEATLGSLTADRQIAAQTLHGPIALLSNGVDFGLFYQRIDFNIVYQRISTSGEPVGQPVVIIPATQAWPNQEIDAVFDPVRNAYAVVRTVPQAAQYGLWLTIVRPEGTVAADFQLSPIIAPSTLPRIAVAENGTLGIVWAVKTPLIDAVYFMAIRPDNSINNASVGQISQFGRGPVIAANDREFIVILRHENNDGVGHLRRVRLSLGGQITSAEAVFLTPRGQDIVPGALVWNDEVGEWGLTYADYAQPRAVGYGEARLHRFTTDGRPPSDSYFSPELGASNVVQLVDELTPSRGGYLGTGDFLGAVPQQGFMSSLMRHCPLLAVPNRPTKIPFNETVTFTTAISGGIGPYDIRWDFGDFTESQFGATTTHRYQRLGKYTITVFVADRAGAQNQQSFEVEVAVPPPPVPPKRRSVRRN